MRNWDDKLSQFYQSILPYSTNRYVGLLKSIRCFANFRDAWLIYSQYMSYSGIDSFFSFEQDHYGKDSTLYGNPLVIDKRKLVDHSRSVRCFQLVVFCLHMIVVSLMLRLRHLFVFLRRLRPAFSFTIYIMSRLSIVLISNRLSEISEPGSTRIDQGPWRS